MDSDMTRESLETRYGRVWNVTELKQDFTVHGFPASLVTVTRKEDGVKGSLNFQHNPRFYFDFMED